MKKFICILFILISFSACCEQPNKVLSNDKTKVGIIRLNTKSDGGWTKWNDSYIIDGQVFYIVDKINIDKFTNKKVTVIYHIEYHRNVHLRYRFKSLEEPEIKNMITKINL
jgi:hypothetical protein